MTKLTFNVGVRRDSLGFLWEDEISNEKKKGGGRILPKQYRPSIPDTGWTLPTPDEFREFHRADVISLDLETKDPDLKSKGPGVRTNGEIVGVAVGTSDGWNRYFPFGHETGPNLEESVVRDYFTRELAKFKGTIVGANLLYDLEYLLVKWGIDVYHCEWLDVQIAEPLIDENAFTYNLDRLANKYVGEGKNDEALYRWSSATFGGEATRADQGGNIWRAPTALAGPYAEGDTDLPMRILKEQRKVIEKENLVEVFSVESRLMKMLLAMRVRGVQVNVAKAHEINIQLEQRATDQRKLLQSHGIHGVWNRDEIAAHCERVGLKYNRTANGGPSFTAKWLDEVGARSDEILATLMEVRKLEKHGGTFVHNYIFDYEVNGRLHCQFHQLRGDGRGAVSGRFSSSNPNLQNIPSRDAELGPLIRSLWEPEEGEDWCSDDYSQVEFRLGVHYGRGESAKRIQNAYWQDETTDFHQAVAELCGISRTAAKGINFGLIYGMGIPTMSAQLGQPVELVREWFSQYHSNMPFVKDLYDAAAATAANRGYVHTLLGRRRRFDLWDNGRWVDEEQRRADPEYFKPVGSREEALEKWGTASRIGTHKALNAILQGGAADVIKKAMVDIWEAGICNVLGAPLLQVHDELNWSVPRTNEGRQAHDESLRLMSSAFDLRVPLLVDSVTVENWGQAKG